MIDDLLNCELSARVTPGDAKCQLYRKSYEPSCRVCLAIPGMNKVVEVDDMSKRGDCVVCGKVDIPLPVPGKCSVCYEKYRKETGKTPPRVVSVRAPKREDVQKRVKAAMQKPAPVAVQEREALCPDPVKAALQPDVARGFKSRAEIEADMAETIDPEFCDTCGLYPCDCFDDDSISPDPIEAEFIDVDCPDCGMSPCACVVSVPSVPDITRHDHVAYLRELAHVMVETMVSELNAAADPEQHSRMYLVACDRLRGRR